MAKRRNSTKTQKRRTRRTRMRRMRRGGADPDEAKALKDLMTGGGELGNVGLTQLLKDELKGGRNNTRRRR